jgi:DNA-binding response OmpR family regulator
MTQGRILDRSTGRPAIMSAQTGKAHIVLIDDEPFMLSAMSSLLGSAGYAVRTVSEWAGVASTVRDAAPQLVLLDYNMPAIKGDKICEILKRNMDNADMRIFIFSSEPESDLVRIVSQCGADGYVRKNLPASELLSQIGTIMGKAALAC